MGLTALSPAAAPLVGDFPANINLGALNGTNGFKLSGVTASDQSGSAVSTAGDANGDGIDDLLIGAFGADPNGDFSGASYVVFGGAGVGSGGHLELSALDGTNG
ncbi:MAG: integrin alpha [Beggiatoa sp.]|nr:integrin alpha [Beggiatoa sp.]